MTSQFQCTHDECPGDDCCPDGDKCNPPKSLKTELIKLRREFELERIAIRKDEREKTIASCIDAVESTTITDVEDARDAIESLRNRGETK